MLARKIDGLVASVAAHGGDAAPVRSAFYVLYVHVAVISLQWSIARRMTVLGSAEKSVHGINLQKCGTRCRGIRLGGCLRRAREHSEKTCAWPGALKRKRNFD